MTTPFPSPLAAAAPLKSVCVYCGTGSAVNEVYRETAAEVGRMLADQGVRLVYGGGSVGLMGIVSLACMQAGGQVTGIIPGHLSEKEGQNHAITDLVLVDTMHARKHLMVEQSDGFIVLPGGLGTLDETFEILTWKYLGLHDKPVVLLNVNGFYDPLLKMIDHMMAEGFTPAHHRLMFKAVATVEELLPALQSQPAAHQRVQSEKL